MIRLTIYRVNTFLGKLNIIHDFYLTFFRNSDTTIKKFTNLKQKLSFLENKITEEKNIKF